LIRRRIFKGIDHMSTTATKRTAKAEELDVIIVGAGFAGV
jgi:NADH dehydrogenase FAD-containing subunit